MGRAKKPEKWHPHCYACQYRIEDFKNWKMHCTPTPDVIGCMMEVTDKETCRKWRDDEKYAKKVIKSIRDRKAVK